MSWKVVRVLALAILVVPCLARPVQAQGKNMFANPSFELGQEGWRMDKAGGTVASFTADEADAKDGQRSALLAVESVADWGTQFGQTMEAGSQGKTYTFAVLAKAVKEPAKVQLEIERSARPWDRVARSEKLTLQKDAWTELHITFKVEKPFPEGWFAYVSCAQAGAAYRVDLFRLYEGEYVPFDKVAKEEARVSGVGLFDTGAPVPAALPGEAIAKKAGWSQVPDDKTAHKFKGEAVIANDRLAVVLRRGAGGAEVYGKGSPPVLRAVLSPADAAEARVDSVAIVKNSPEAAAVDVSFKGGGKAAVLRYELGMGQPFVKTEARSGARALRAAAPCRFVVLPDFFADDIVADAREIPVPKADLPSENFLVHLLGGGEAVLATVSTSRDQDARITLSGDGAARAVADSEIAFDKDGKIWAAVLEAPGIWYARDVARDETDKVVPFGWKMPFPAQWRLDWRQADKLVGSWEMLLQKAGGDFEKPGVFGNPDGIGANRKRWTTVLGSFLYPCWIDKEGQGYIQPLKSNVVRFEGPAVVYPINRTRSTPLDAFTVADVMRATLGVGPCEYILDLEGQKQSYRGRATCGARDALRGIYGAKQQKQKRAEIEKILQEVNVFVRFIRSRIDGYVTFGHNMLAYLEEQKKAHPQQAAPIDEMITLTRAIDGYVDKRKVEIKTPDYVTELTDKFRATLLDYEGEDALPKVKAITEAIVVVGGNQDELAGECRMAVKNLRQRAGLAMAMDPRVADIAKEIRKRTQEVLRQPASHEGARH